jgi:hypothetical protein
MVMVNFRVTKELRKKMDALPRSVNISKVLREYLEGFVEEQTKGDSKDGRPT